MMDVQIREARPQDAEAIGRLGRQTFLDTFVEGFGIPYPAKDLETYLNDSFSPAAMTTKLAEPEAVWWVAETDRGLIAFANAGPNTLPHPRASREHAELRRLYVDRSAQGLGIGSRLLAESLDWMQAHTAGPLWIGVWSGNRRAQALYASHGFEKVGDYQYPVGSWMDDEFIMMRP
jgi:ribosomal protein S18 acetylase RimI-like enzyme